MKNIKLILKILLAIIAAFIICFIFYQGSQLKDAETIIKSVNIELKTLKDSIQSTQKSLEDVVRQLDYTSFKLNILTNERDVLLLEEKKKQVKTWEELQILKEQILKKEQERELLKKEAEKFEL